MLKFLDELKSLNLPAGQYAIFGSGPLAIRDIRDANDLDLIVKQELWGKLASQYTPHEKETPKGPISSIAIGNIEIYKEWMNLTPKINEIIDSAEIINGLPYVKLEYVIEWKTYLDRDKDKNDLKLIAAYQKRRG
jgi:hypothetical protein